VVEQTIMEPEEYEAMLEKMKEKELNGEDDEDDDDYNDEDEDYYDPSDNSDDLDQ